MTILILVSCLHLQILKNQLHEYLENHINEYDKIVVDVRNNQGGYEKHFNDFIENNLQVLNSKKKYICLYQKYIFSRSNGR